MSSCLDALTAKLSSQHIFALFRFKKKKKSVSCGEKKKHATVKPKCQRKEKVPQWMSEVSVRGGARRPLFAAAVLVSILPTLEQKST